ncbi:unnamed protein product [Lactuca virosa]|uniref:Uncharacterized protein n=1 Tax=Lactuca virosa TaxID=75947 RepID=A0AAU9NS26_9ASTR|nr:unnamed protein product [Lactuca virosa]
MQCVNLKWLSVKQNKLQSLKEAHNYFLEYISKAYQALTDPISRSERPTSTQHSSSPSRLLPVLCLEAYLICIFISYETLFSSKKNEASTSGTRTPSLNKRWVWGRGEKMFLGTHVQGKIPEVYGQQGSSKRTLALNVIKEAQNLRGTFRVILEIWLGVDMIKKSINILGLSVNNVSLG